MKIFLDANILFSASRRDSILARFIKYLLNNKHQLFTNSYAREEALRNILAKNFSSDADLSSLMQKIACDNTLTADLIVGLAEKDQPILRGAIACKCDYLLTSDVKDFGKFMRKNSFGIQIGTPEHLALLLKLNR